MTQPASSYTVEGNNIDGVSRGGRASDIPSFVFCTVGRESFATLSQSILARIVVLMDNVLCLKMWASVV